MKPDELYNAIKCLEPVNNSAIVRLDEQSKVVDSNDFLEMNVPNIYIYIHVAIM